MNRQRAEAILAGFAGRRVLVVGDLMVDEHIRGHAARISPEAPVLVVDAQEHSFVPGGAANVAHQLLAFGANVLVAGVVGEDAIGERLLEELRELGADTRAIVRTKDRPTTQKTRILAGSQQIVRVDWEKRAPLPESVSERLIARSRDALGSCDALLFSDYDKGVLGRATVESLVAFVRGTADSHIVVTANPKPSSARFYADVDVAQFNKSEADLTMGGAHRFDSPEETTFHAAGARLRENLRVRNLLVTRSAEGMTLFQSGGAYLDIAPHRVEVFDGTGAGDSTIAGLTLAMTTGASAADAAVIGNASGGAVVRKVGVATADRSEVAALFS